MISNHKNIFLLCLLSFVLYGGALFSPHFAQAEEKASSGSIADVMASSSPSMPNYFSETHPLLHLTPDKSEILHLDAEAASIVIGNPAHVNVLLDTPKTLIVVPRAEGASHFTVIGKDGNTLMQRHVVVGGSKENYVRIRRSCANAANSSNCRATSVYFCPDMCHEVSENTQ